VNRNDWKSSPVRARRTLSILDEESGYHFVVASPAVEVDLWAAFADGALEAYRKYDVEVALEYDLIKDGRSTELFFAALDPHGSVVAGSRSLGPYRTADESHALSEWSEPGSRDRIGQVLEGCVPYGLVEAKSGWVNDGVVRRRELTAAVARMTTYCMELLDSRYLVGTTADNALHMWLECGGRVVEEIPSTSYPDHRYRTRLLLWDEQVCRSEARTRQVDALLSSDPGPVIGEDPVTGLEDVAETFRGAG